MCLICALACSASKQASVADVIAGFKDVPDDDRFPEQLRLADGVHGP
jgi:hypothetical protein